MSDSILEEFQDIDLGDERLNQRGKSLIETLAADPQASVNAALGGWSESIAAYRFLDNDNIQPEEILKPHVQATERRIEQESTVLIVQDTTELDFTTHPTTDSGVLNRESRLGVYDHSHVAFTPDGLCLGVVQADFFDRSADSLGKSQERKKGPPESKESYRWVKGYRLACEMAQAHPDQEIISVSDSESDIYDIFVEHQQRNDAADFVVRAKHPRRSKELAPEEGPKVYKKVHDEVAAEPVRKTRVIDLPKTPKRSARTAKLEIRAKRVTVQPPHPRPELPEVTYNLVLVDEVDGPNDGTDVGWSLITTLPIDSVDEMLRVIDIYVGRWPIEVYFRVLKTGCKVEEMQLKTNARQRRCLMLYKIIAWRLMYLTYLGRECPELSCEVMFSESQWKPAWKVVRNEPLPDTPPTLGEFIEVVAQLGGHNGRKHDSKPGPQSIWIGIRRITDFALAWDAFGPDAEN